MDEELERAEEDLLREFAAALAFVLNSGDWAIDAALARMEQATARFAAAWTAQMHGAAERVAADLSVLLGRPITFDRAGSFAVLLSREHAASLARDLVAGQRGAFEAARAAGLEARSVVGMSADQVRAVEAYRRMLQEQTSGALDRALRDQSFDELIAAGGSLPVARMVAAYRRNQIQFRAEGLVEMEAVSALEGGKHALLEQLRLDGVDLSSIVREWDTKRDQKVRASHQHLQGQRRGVGTPFHSGLGNAIMYPGDPSVPIADRARCRCRLRLRRTA
jgi:hypothetical protein